METVKNGPHQFIKEKAVLEEDRGGPYCTSTLQLEVCRKQAGQWHTTRGAGRLHTNSREVCCNKLAGTLYSWRALEAAGGMLLMMLSDPGMALLGTLQVCMVQHCIDDHAARQSSGQRAGDTSKSSSNNTST